MPKEYLGEGIDPEVEAQVRAAAAKLEELGAVVEECSLHYTRYAMPAYYLIAPAEASSNLGRYDGVRYGLRVQAKDVVDMFCDTRKQGFGAEVKRRIMLGTYALSSGYYDAYYLKALKVRNLIKQDYDQAFAKYDCLIAPTAPTTALHKGQNQDPLALYKGIFAPFQVIWPGFRLCRCHMVWIKTRCLSVCSCWEKLLPSLPCCRLLMRWSKIQH